MRIETPRRARAAVSLLPLVDVLLILLVFFLLASNFVRWSTLQLAPASSASGDEPGAGALIVRVAADGTLSVAGEVLATADLVARVQARSRPQVVVAPLPDTSVQTLVTVMNTLSAAGLRELTLAGSPR